MDQVGGDQPIGGPKGQKVGGTGPPSPGPHGCCAYDNIILMYRSARSFGIRRVHIRVYLRGSRSGSHRVVFIDRP